MVYADLYVINLTINGTKIELEPQNYSFSTTENINSLYLTASVEFYDGTGLIQEYLGTALGTSIEIGFGNKDFVNTASFKVNFDSLEEADSPGYLTGKVDLFLIHDMFFAQQIASKAHQNRISKVVNSLVSKYNFSEIDIDDTGNEDIWYQPLITDAKFIQERLLPYAYSYNAAKTPFYSFITSDNKYHFRNLKSMSDEGKSVTIQYKSISGDSEEEKNRAGENKTSSIKRWRNQYKNIWKIQNRNLYSIDRTDGTLIKDSDNITDYPAENNLKLPVVNDQANKVTSWHNDYFSETETGSIENQTGLQTSSQKEGMFVDEFLLIQPFNPIIHAGQAIQLNIYVLGKTGSKLSTNFSGKYTVIECEHIWDGETSRAYTKLVIGRKYLAVPNSYLAKGLLI